MEDNEKKYDNKYLLERQLEMIKLFYERKLLTKEQYEFEVQTLTTRIKTDEKKESWTATFSHGWTDSSQSSKNYIKCGARAKAVKGKKSGTFFVCYAFATASENGSFLQSVSVRNGRTLSVPVFDEKR